MNDPKRTVFKQLGIAAARLLDIATTGGIVTALYETAVPVGRALWEFVSEPHGLNWDLPYSQVYRNDLDRLLSIKIADDEKAVLPQIPTFLPGPEFDDQIVRLELDEPDFKARARVSEVLDFHKRHASNKIFHDGENARLLNANSEAFRFQGCSYFDYISTNLALDCPLPVGESLREQIHGNGRLDPLSDSVLANSTGINGLVFSSDGQMIFQHRRKNVLIRPGEMCPGFSGTIDKKDISDALLRGGRLFHLDAPREMVEELGVTSDAIADLRFLGVTRELIRGGAPEFFYAVDLDISAEQVLTAFPRDREGDKIAIPFGALGRTLIKKAFPPSDQIKLFSVLKRLKPHLPAKMSVPLLTNLVLWQRMNSPHDSTELC